MGNAQRKQSRAHHGSSRPAGYAPRTRHCRRHGKRPAGYSQSDSGKTFFQEVTLSRLRRTGRPAHQELPPGRARLGYRQFSISEFFLFLPPLPKIFLPSFPIPLALPLPILAAPFPVPTPTSLPAPAAPLPRSAAAWPGCKVTRLPAAPAVPLPRLSAPLPAPLPMSSPPLPISLPELGSTFCFSPFGTDCVWDVC